MPFQTLRQFSHFAHSTDEGLQGGLAQMKEASWHTGALLFRKGGPAEGVYGLCGTQACAIGEVYAVRPAQIELPRSLEHRQRSSWRDLVGIWTIERGRPVGKCTTRSTF
jgi:hypothetical protein